MRPRTRLQIFCRRPEPRGGVISPRGCEGAEAIVVIGGHHSANTRKLAKLAQSHDRPTFHVETAEELNADALVSFETVGVTAGASTPEFIIDTVCRKLEEM